MQKDHDMPLTREPDQFREILNASSLPPLVEESGLDRISFLMDQVTELMDELGECLVQHAQVILEQAISTQSGSGGVPVERQPQAHALVESLGVSAPITSLIAAQVHITAIVKAAIDSLGCIDIKQSTYRARDCACSGVDEMLPSFCSKPGYLVCKAHRRALIDADSGLFCHQRYPTDYESSEDRIGWDWDE